MKTFLTLLLLPVCVFGQSVNIQLIPTNFPTVTPTQLTAATNNLAGALDQKRTDATNDLNTALQSRILNATNGVVATAGALKTGATINTADGSSLTNLTYRYTTNPIPALVLSWGKAYYTNLQADVTIALGTPDPYSYESVVLFATNSTSTDHKITSPAGVWGTPGSGTPAVLYATNKMFTKFVWEHYAQINTNVSKQDFAP